MESLLHQKLKTLKAEVKVDSQKIRKKNNNQTLVKKKIIIFLINL